MLKRHAARFPIALLAGLVTWVGAGPAHAQSPIPGNYAPNAFTGMKGAVLPPPGTAVIENGTLFYNTSEFVDGEGVTTGTSASNALANRTILGYVFDFEILGANYMPAAIFVFTNQLLRPVQGSEKDFQVGDWILQPLALGWHGSEWHGSVGYNVWLPTGRFSAGAPNNTGKGLWSHLLFGGATWLQSTPKPWAATAQVRYEFFGKQETTDIRPGQVMTVEVSGGKEVFNGFDLGLVGFASFQTTEETGSAPGTDTTRYGILGLGPEINWRPTFLPGFQAGLRASWDVEARNSSQGFFAILHFLYAFGIGG
jgi:hypothetical protein